MSEFSVAVLALVACVFAASAVTKLSSRPAYRSFRAGLRETALVPGRLLPGVASALSGAEAVTAAGLAAAAALVATAGPGGQTVAVAALAFAALLTAVLASGVAVVMRRGTRARCACFGAHSGRPLGAAHLIRNLALLAVDAAGLAGSLLTQERPATAGVIVAAAAGAVTALVFVRWEELADLFGPIPPSPAAARSAPHADSRSR